MPIPDRPGAQALIERFDDPAVRSLILLGSHSRGQAGPFSDIDLIRIVADGDGRAGARHSHLIDDQLVAVNDEDAARIEQWFIRPEVAIQAVAGLRDGVALVDRDGTFAAIHARAQAFTWDAVMQERAGRWVSDELIGWIEEVHKGLNGLSSRHEGRLIHARHGLTFGMVRILQVHRGLMCRSDNDFLDAATSSAGEASEWTRMLRRGFAIEPATLEEQVRAGLRLYVLTAELVAPAICPGHAPLVARTVRRIDAALLQ